MHQKMTITNLPNRHNKDQVPMKDLSSYHGKAFLGIDAGSTTTKAALVGEDGTLLYSFYHNNEGDPLGTTISRNQGYLLPDFRKMWKSSTPALPDMVKL